MSDIDNNVSDEKGLGRRKFLTFAGTTAATVSVAGCTGGSGSDTDNNGTDGTDETGGNQDDDSDTGTNEVVLASDSPIRAEALDPGQGSTDYGATITAINMYDPLVDADPETLAPVEFIATDWYAEDDGKTLVVEIREGIPHKSGNTLTAEDVAYSFNRILALEIGYVSTWSGFMNPGDASARDEHTVEFKMSEAFGPILATFWQLFIVDKQVLEENEKDGDYGRSYIVDGENDVGTGPYTMRSWDREREMVLDKHEDYWRGWEDNQFDVGRFQIVPEPSTQKELIRSGEIDIPYHAMSTDIIEEMATYDGVRKVEEPQFYIFVVPMNSTKPPFDDINVRKAIIHSTDMETIREDVLTGNTMAGPVPRSMHGHNENLEPYTQNLDKAKAELDKAEYSVEEINSTEPEYNFFSGSAEQRKTGLAIQQGAKQLGINIEVRGLQGGPALELLKDQENLSMFGVYFTASYPSPDVYTYGMYHPSTFGKSIFSGGWYTTEEITEVTEKAHTTVNEEERIELYKEAQKLIYDGYPAFYLSNLTYTNAIRESLGGWRNMGMRGRNEAFYNFHRK